MAAQIFVTLLTILLSYSPQVTAMSIFNTGRACLFSSSKITITKDGRPIINSKVIRRWEWKEELKEDFSYTDDEGIVEFSAVKSISLSKALPVQFFVAQQLAVIIDNREEVFWENAKMNPSENSELEGSPLILSCDINDKERTYRIGSTELYTKCKWGNN